MSSSESQKALGAMPEWNLADLYSGIDDPALKQDLETAQKNAKEFKNKYEGKLAALSGDDLAAAITSYEKMDETLGKIMSFAQLYYTGDQEDQKRAAFYQTMQERVTTISTETLFFTLEINKIDDAILQKQSASKSLQRYAPWLRDVRVYRPYQLADDIEKTLHEKRVTGRAAWNRLFDETLAALRFPFEGKELTESEILNLMQDKNRDTRAKAAKVFADILNKNIKLFAFITNTLAKDKSIEDDWRKFPRPISSRNLSNYVEDEVVDALIKA